MNEPANNAGREPLLDRRRHSVSAKIVFLVLACTFTTALVISAIAIHAGQRHIRAEFDLGFPAALERSRAELTIWFAEGATALQTLASSPAGRSRLRSLGANRSPERDRARKRAQTALNDFATQSIHFDAAALLSPDGEWIAHTAGFETSAEARPALPRSATPRQRVVLPTSPPAALTVVPVDPRDPRSGFVVGRYDRSLLELLLSQQQHQLPGTLLLTDSEGRVLAAVGAEAGVVAADARVIAHDPQHAPGTVREYADRHGARALGATLPLSTGEPPDWRVVIEAPFAVAFVAVHDLVTPILAADVLIILVSIGFAWRFTTRMLRPLEDLSEGARLASRGDLGQAVPDPGTYDEIGRLTRAFNEMMGKLNESQSALQQANRQLTDKNDELQRANEVLSQLSITDGLTKLHNHRYFQESLTREIKRQSRNHKPLSMLLVDLDDFKALNDRLGHASGDELLMRVAAIMDTTVRESDLLARYGGEEFVVLAADTDLEGAVALAEKIRMAVEQAPHIVNDSLRPVRITVSVGVAQFDANRRRFFEAADRALYRAKDQGKNCVVAATADGPLE